MEMVSMHDFLARLGSWTGPPALVASLWTLGKQIQALRKTNTEIRKMKAETKSIDDKLTPDILKTLAEAAKLRQEVEGLQTKLPLEVNKLEQEISKLRAERGQIQASAISELILANRAKLNCERIVQCIDEMSKRAKDIHLGAEEAYGIFREAKQTSAQIMAAHNKIQKFINESRDRGSLERAVAELQGLLQPFRNSIVDTLVQPVQQFLGNVSFSSQHCFPRQDVADDFADLIAKHGYEPRVETREIIRDWLNSVRNSYDDLERVLGQVAAQVELRATAIE